LSYRATHITKITKDCQRALFKSELFIDFFNLLAPNLLIVVLRFFRINDPYRLLGILFILILISLPLFIDPVPMLLGELKMQVLGETLNSGNTLYSELITETPPLYALIGSWLEMLFGRSILPGRVISLIMIFFQVSFFTIILINSRAHNENTYLPGLIAGVLSFFSFDMLTFSNELVASTLLLFALYNLFKEVEFRIQRDETVLNLGLYIGLASLLVFSYSVYLPGVILLLSIFTRLTIRKGLLVIFGFLIPHAFLMLRYFMKGNFYWVIHHFYKANFAGVEGSRVPLSSILILGVVPIVFLLFSLFTLNREARLTKYQSQLSQIMFLWLLLAMVEIILSQELSPHKFITCIPSLSYFISHYLLLIRRKWIAELALWVFMIAILTTMYFSRYGIIKKVDYSNLHLPKSNYEDIKDKRILIFGSDWGLLENNHLATGFYDWRLSQPIITQLDYFDHVVMIDKAFRKDSPEIIVDRENFMAGIIQRIPALQSKYYRKGDFYIKME